MYIIESSMAYYGPNEIKSPEEIISGDYEFNTYSGTLGRPEYEVIATKLISKSQQKGVWVSLPLSELMNIFPSNDYKNKMTIEGMVYDGFLTIDLQEENNLRFRLTDRAVSRIVQKYHKNF